MPATTPIDLQARAGFFENLPYFATYTSNWFVDLHSGQRVIFYYAWSLATEEQFYLLWPWVVALGRGWRLPVLAAAALILIAAATPALATAGVLAQGGVAHRVLASIAPPICLGCILACVLHYRPGFQVAFRLLGATWSAPAALAALVAAVLLPTPDGVTYLLMAWLVGAVCVRERHPLNPVLANAVVRHVGAISYGMYLLHMLALNLTRRLLPTEDLPLSVTFLTALAVTALAADLAFRFYERPFLRLKDRLSAAPSAATTSPPRKASPERQAPHSPADRGWAEVWPIATREEPCPCPPCFGSTCSSAPLSKGLQRRSSSLPRSES
jgi:peptidoglycan/LPS O-acetylase OafA/YrhL